MMLTLMTSYKKTPSFKMRLCQLSALPFPSPIRAIEAGALHGYLPASSVRECTHVPSSAAIWGPMKTLLIYHQGAQSDQVVASLPERAHLRGLECGEELAAGLPNVPASTCIRSSVHHTRCRYRMPSTDTIGLVCSQVLF